MQFWYGILFSFSESLDSSQVALHNCQEHCSEAAVVLSRFRPSHACWSIFTIARKKSYFSLEPMVRVLWATAGNGRWSITWLDHLLGAKKWDQTQQARGGGTPKSNLMGLVRAWQMALGCPVLQSARVLPGVCQVLFQPQIHPNHRTLRVRARECTFPLRPTKPSQHSCMSLVCLYMRGSPHDIGCFRGNYSPDLDPGKGSLSCTGTTEPSFPLVA